MVLSLSLPSVFLFLIFPTIFRRGIVESKVSIGSRHRCDLCMEPARADCSGSSSLARGPANPRKLPGKAVLSLMTSNIRHTAQIESGTECVSAMLTADSGRWDGLQSGEELAFKD